MSSSVEIREIIFGGLYTCKKTCEIIFHEYSYFEASSFTAGNGGAANEIPNILTYTFRQEMLVTKKNAVKWTDTKF